MKFICFLLAGLIFVPSADAAWILWHRGFVTRAPAKIKSGESFRMPQLLKDVWEIEDATETRKECIEALRQEYFMKKEVVAAVYGDVKINERKPAGIIKATFWFNHEYKYEPTGELMSGGYQEDFWCLPAGVDPRTTRVTVDQKE